MTLPEGVIGYGVIAKAQRWPDGPWDPDLATGARVQAVCEAMELAAAQERWVAVDEIG